jgi:predicted glutamine amidotransferase
MNNNPLKQYFRRPSVHLKLPSKGLGYPPGVINMTETGELPVYPMTAIDEITSKTPDALFNGSAVVEIIKSCVPDIKDPWAIKNIDIDSILIAIRAASGTGEVELETSCPKCNGIATYQLNLVNVLNTMVAGDYTQELAIGNLKIKFRPLEYREMNKANIEQLEVQKIFMAIEQTDDMNEKNRLSEQALRGLTDLTMVLVSKSIEYIKTPDTLVTENEYILDYLQNCDKNDYTTIRDYNAALRAKAELQPMDITCTECSNQYKQPFTLNMSDFFG